MVSSPRTRLLARAAAVLAALGALLVPATAGAAAHAPVVRSVAPLHVAVGETLTLRGSGFRRGRGRDTVIFKRDGGRPVFIRADLATAKLIRVTLPKRLERALLVRRGLAVPTRFRVRVVAGRAGRSFTALRRSPIVEAERPPTPPTPPPGAPNGDCDGDKIVNAQDADDDDDLLPDALEAQIKTDSCNADSDGDGVEDGYEYRSAQDLNDDDYQDANRYRPYPVKRPYPNPLYGDAGTDYDGDGLSLGEEQALWRYTTAHGAPRTLSALTYSDGEQYSALSRGPDGRRRPGLAADGYAKQQQFLAGAAAGGDLLVQLPATHWDPALRYDVRDANTHGGVQPAERLYYDFDGNGVLSDDERDEDADGLTNFDEAHGRMLSAYWQGCYQKETPYPVAYAGMDLADPDTDGDGILDGVDDQDHDDIPNLMELSRSAASDRPAPPLQCHDKGVVVDPAPPQGRVNPFNPCLPFWDGRTCQRHPGLQGAFAPFDESPDYLVLN